MWNIWGVWLESMGKWNSGECGETSLCCRGVAPRRKSAWEDRLLQLGWVTHRLNCNSCYRARWISVEIFSFEIIWIQRVGNAVLKDKKSISDTEKDRDPRNMERKSPCQILWLQIDNLQGPVRLSDLRIRKEDLWNWNCSHIHRK